jgi:hypothetical protein
MEVGIPSWRDIILAVNSTLMGLIERASRANVVIRADAAAKLKGNFTE